MGHAVNVYGNAQVDTAQKKFGTGSLYLDGTSELTITDRLTDFDYGTGDLTQECFIMFEDKTFPAPSSLQRIIHKETNGSGLAWNTDGQITCDAPPIDFLWSPSNMVWYHLAVARRGTTVKIFLDGVTQSTVISAFNVQSTTPFEIGGEISSGSRYFKGWIDEVRCSKGIARYTGDFTPPAAPFVGDDKTVLLMHMDGADGSTTFPDDSYNPAISLMNFVGKKRSGI